MIFRRILTSCRYGNSRKYVYCFILLGSLVCLLFYKRFRKTYTGTKYDFLGAVFGEIVLPEPTQEEIDYFAHYVRIEFTVEDNFASGDKMGGHGFFTARISLFNTGNDVIHKTRWQLYGYFMRLAEPLEAPYPDGFYVYSCGLKLFHVDGSLYRFEPAGRGFTEVGPHQRLTCRLKLNAFQVSKTDTLPRWYVTAVNTVPKIVENTDDETLSFVTDFNKEQQYKMRFDDHNHPYTPQQRYKIYNENRREVNRRVKVIPTPLEIDVQDDIEMEFDAKAWVIVKSDIFLQEIVQFSNQTKMKIVKSKPMRKFLQISKADVVVSLDGSSSKHPDAYVLEANTEKQHISITAGTNQSLFYAFQTLRSILFAPEAGASGSDKVMIPGFTIKDAPRYSYRGLHLDVVRNFISADEVKKIIDLLALYKMNKLHLHLSDDEGWRLEIPGIPELTKIGSFRCHDLNEEQCILPMLGSGPYSNTSGSGYYTVADYKNILQYAKNRHVQIIPEFDMPGHSRAAIKSIHSKSQRVVRKETKSDMYSIIDDQQVSEFLSAQFFSDNVINPCIDSSYAFIKKILLEVKSLHKDIQPLTLYHFGGDEVADGAWDNSVQCKLLKEKRKDIESQYDLMRYFVNGLTKTASEEGVSVGAWEDGMLSHGKDGVGVPFPRDVFQNKDIYVYVWKRPIEQHTPHRAKLFANKGYKVVLAYGSYLYFDHPYEPDPGERGLYWATRKISTKDVWSFTQDVMFRDKHLDCPEAIKDRRQCLELLIPENVVGIQAELWTETVRTNENVEYMLLPRLLAVAERAWHKASWETAPEGVVNRRKEDDWSNFVNVVGYQELLRLDKYGYQYRVPPPGAMTRGGKVFFNTEFPGLDIEYFSTESNSWKVVSRDMVVNKPVSIRTRSADGRRYSRVVVFDPALSSAALICSHYYWISLVILTVLMI